MDGVTHHFFPFCPVILGNDNGGTRRKAHKEADQQVDDGTSRAANCSQRLFAYKPAHNNGIHGVIKLLEKGSKQDREEENQKLFPDDSFGDLIAGD